MGFVRAAGNDDTRAVEAQIETVANSSAGADQALTNHTRDERSQAGGGGNETTAELRPSDN